LGGGFGIRYAAEQPLAFERLTQTRRVSARLKRTKARGPFPRHSGGASRVPYRLDIEPGRSIVGDGSSLARSLPEAGLKEFHCR
jgi:diaminopimelate decarboxylase